MFVTDFIKRCIGTKNTKTCFSFKMYSIPFQFPSVQYFLIDYKKRQVANKYEKTQNQNQNLEVYSKAYKLRLIF